MATKALANGGVRLVGGVQAEFKKKLQRNVLQLRSRTHVDAYVDRHRHQDRCQCHQEPDRDGSHYPQRHPSGETDCLIVAGPASCRTTPTPTWNVSRDKILVWWWRHAHRSTQTQLIYLDIEHNTNKRKINGIGAQALPPPMGGGVPIDLPPQSKFLRRGPDFRSYLRKTTGAFAPPPPAGRGLTEWYLFQAYHASCLVMCFVSCHIMQAVRPTSYWHIVRTKGQVWNAPPVN